MRRFAAILSSLALTAAVASAQPSDPAPAPDPGSPAPAPGTAAPAPGTAAPAPAPVAPARPVVAPLTEEEKKILTEIEGDFKRYAEAADRHHKRSQLILSREYDTRRRSLEKRYAEKIAAAERDHRSRQTNAMKMMEKFIAEHPDHGKFTPDVMFRLAELYLDEANYIFDQGFELDNPAEGAEPAPEGDDAVAEGDPPAEGDDADGADDGTGYEGADYSKALAMWNDILLRFPEYRQRYGVLYLLAYYLNQTGEERRALQIARGLVCKNKYQPLAEPPPRPSDEDVRLRLTPDFKRAFVNPYNECEPEGENKKIIAITWVRIVGDIHFGTPGELGEAIASYEKVARDKKALLYDEALYKLAWSYYRNDDFMKGIEAFDEAIKYSDTLVAAGKEPLPLRPEALQYIAISFTDPWGSDELPDAKRSFDRAWAFYKDRLTEPHVRDVFVQLGDTFELLEAWEESVASYRIALKYWPLHPRNPIAHQKIVNVYQLSGNNNAADEEAALLAQLYAPGSQWYAANETNREAMAAYKTIGERMLRAAAENIHRSAQLMRADWEINPTPQGKVKYIEQYKKAATLYRRFVEEHPTSDMVYEFTFRLGQVMYFAEQYDQAIIQYLWVRDHRELSEQRFEKAALGIVQSYEAEIQRQIKAGTLQEPPDPQLADLKAMPKPITPRSVPQVYQDYRSALDEYQKLVNNPSTAPKMGLNAGMISYRFMDLKDAEQRFKYTFKNFCGVKESVTAKDNLLAIYEATGDDAKFDATNKEFITSKCGTDADVALAIAQNRSKEFREAEDLFNAQQYGPAAIAFYRYLKKAPPEDPNLPIALYNSAVAYDKAGKPKTAVYLFKEFTDNPDKKFRDSEYYLPALYLTAMSHYKAFDYKSAVDVFLNVVKVSSQKNRKPSAGDRTNAQIRLDALYNAALMRELDRVYSDPRGQRGTGAASLYQRYHDAEKDRRKKDRALWSIARIWDQAGSTSRLSKAYSNWRSRYGKDQGNGDDYVFSYYNMAKLYRKKGSSSSASRAQTATLKAWADIGRPKGTPAATMAAEFAFAKAETKKKPFDRYKITRAPTTKKAAEAALGKLDKLANSSVTAYQDLAQYDSGIWSLAALVRIGDVRFFQGLKIKDIPTPKEILKLDERAPDKGILFQWEDQLDKLVKPLENQAQAQWVKVLDAGKRQRVSNEWTRLATERLHDFISQQNYPVIREELREGTDKP